MTRRTISPGRLDPAGVPHVAAAFRGTLYRHRAGAGAGRTAAGGRNVSGPADVRAGDRRLHTEAGARHHHQRSAWTRCHLGGRDALVLALSRRRTNHDAGPGRRSRAEAWSADPRAASWRHGYAAPGEEHWHGAAPDSSAHFFQTSIGNTTTMWMEEVGRDDYLGNDTGIASRNEFLRTGIRKKDASATSTVGTIPPPASPQGGQAAPAPQTPRQ